MITKLRSPRRWWLVPAAVVVLALATSGGLALAGHESAEVKSYTGCLTTDGGTLTSIAEGDAPLRACTSGTKQVHLSGGDITQIVAGDGLVGGGDNGSVTLSLKPGFALPQSCTSGQVVKWDGSGWACAADIDTDTQYTAGTGLRLDGTQFSIAPRYRVLNNEGCTTGKFVNGIGDTGHIQCATPPQSTGQALSATQASQVGLPDGGESSVRHLVNLPLPAGTWVLVGKGALTAPGDPNNNSFIQCSLRQQDGTKIDQTSIDHPDDGVFHGHGVALAAVLTTAGETVTASCFAEVGADGVGARNFRIVAMKAG